LTFPFNLPYDTLLKEKFNERVMIINILWDFDGTLFDTYPALVAGFVQLSGTELDRNEVLQWLKKDSKTAFKHYGIDESRRGEYQTYFNYHSVRISKPFNHVEEALAAVKSNVIVTHRDKESTLYLLEKYQLSKYFKEIVSVEEQGFTRKPHRSSYEYILKSHHIDLVVGDRELDLIPARELNIKTVAFQNPSIEADFHIDSYSEFKPSVLNRL
jgi:HAD superfamily hydrolase (TIGR01549 family)